MDLVRSYGLDLSSISPNSTRRGGCSRNRFMPSSKMKTPIGRAKRILHASPGHPPFVIVDEAIKGAVGSEKIVSDRRQFRAEFLGQFRGDLLYPIDGLRSGVPIVDVASEWHDVRLDFIDYCGIAEIDGTVDHSVVSTCAQRVAAAQPSQNGLSSPLRFLARLVNVSSPWNSEAMPRPSSWALHFVRVAPNSTGT